MSHKSCRLSAIQYLTVQVSYLIVAKVSPTLATYAINVTSIHRIGEIKLHVCCWVLCECWCWMSESGSVVRGNPKFSEQMCHQRIFPDRQNCKTSSWKSCAHYSNMHLSNGICTISRRVNRTDKPRSQETEGMKDFERLTDWYLQSLEAIQLSYKVL